MPEASTRTTGFGALAVFAKRVINSVRRTLERTAIARELAALNDRELADIGLGRGDIAAVAEPSVTAPARPGLVAAFGEMVHDLLVAPVVLWNKRRAAFSALNALDNRMLADIGVARAEIGDVVKGLHKSVSYPAVSLDVVAPIAAWNRARADRQPALSPGGPHAARYRRGPRRHRMGGQRSRATRRSPPTATQSTGAQPHAA